MQNEKYATFYPFVHLSHSLAKVESSRFSRRTAKGQTRRNLLCWELGLFWSSLQFFLRRKTRLGTKFPSSVLKLGPGARRAGAGQAGGNPEFWHKHINMIILRAYWATHQWPHSHRRHRGMVEMDKCGLYGWGRIEDKLTIAKLWQLKQQAEDFFVTMWWYDCLLLFLEQCCYCIDEMQLCAVLWLKCWE